MSGVALLIARVLAGLVWSRLGAEFTFGVGALFSTLALVLLRLQPRMLAINSANSSG